MKQPTITDAIAELERVLCDSRRRSHRREETVVVLHREACLLLALDVLYTVNEPEAS